MTSCARRDASFGVRRGQVLGLLGPNGAGKTSTISVLTGFAPPSSGRVYVGGVDVEKGKEILEGFCPQHTALWPWATAKEHLVLLARLRGLNHVYIYIYEEIKIVMCVF